MQHERFHYKTLEDVKAKADELGVKLPFAADTHALTEPLKVQGVTFHNRMGIAPMEGADSCTESVKLGIAASSTRTLSKRLYSSRACLLLPKNLSLMELFEHLK